jgi:hypothetical protein
VLQLLKNMLITCHVGMSHSDDAATSYRDDALHWHLTLEDSYSYVPVLMKETLYSPNLGPLPFVLLQCPVFVTVPCFNKGAISHAQVNSPLEMIYDLR